MSSEAASKRMPKWAGNVLLATIIVIFLAIISPAIIQPQEFAHRLKVATQAYFPQSQHPSKLDPNTKYHVDCTSVTPVK